MGGGGLILILKGTNMEVQYPILDAKELEAIDRLSNRYQKLVEPNQIMKIGNELGKFVPKEVKTLLEVLGKVSQNKKYMLMFWNYLVKDFMKLKNKQLSFLLVRRIS